MKEVRICLEVCGIAENENGMPCPAGLQISVGETEKEIDYAEMVKDIDIPRILKMTFLEGHVKPEDVKVITPEEYDERYGGEEG